MKHLKILGLAVVAAAALTAFVGASSASATVLCKVEGTGTPTGTTCPSGSAYPEKTVIEASLVPKTKAILHTTFKTIECEESAVKGETSKEEAEPLTGPEGTLSFSKCNCSEVKVLKAGTLNISWLNPENEKKEHVGSHNGTLSSTGNETTVVCSSIFGNVHCIYATENTDVGTLAGGNPAKFTAKAHIPVSPTNPLCSEESEWIAEYEVTAPKPLFVAGHT